MWTCFCILILKNCNLPDCFYSKKSRTLLDFPVKFMIIYFVYIFVNLLQNIKTLFHKRSIIDCFEIWQLVLSEFVSRFLLRSNFMVNVYGPEFFFSHSVSFWKANSLWFSHFYFGNTMDTVIRYAFLSSLLRQMLGFDGHEKVPFPKIWSHTAK